MNSRQAPQPQTESKYLTTRHNLMMANKLLTQPSRCPLAAQLTVGVPQGQVVDFKGLHWELGHHIVGRSSIGISCGIKSSPSPAGAHDKNQLKVQGLAFGQAFQTVFKVSAMYSVDHPAAGRSMQQSWDLLVPLLKQGGQFTFGFMNQRVLLNSSLVTQTNLTHLEVEFTKREIAAITFQAGVTLKDFKRALALLTTRPMVIAERGGIKKFLAANPIEGVRITPAAKPKEEGDMIEVGMDIESYLTAQAILGPEGASGSSRRWTCCWMPPAPKKPQGFGGSPREMVAVADEAARNTVADPDGDSRSC